MQVRNANKTIEKLRDEILWLQSGDQKKVTDLQEKVTRLQEKLTKLKIENKVLKSWIQYMPMPPGMYAAHHVFHSQPLPFQKGLAMSFGAGLTLAHVPQVPGAGSSSTQQACGASEAIFDPTLKNLWFLGLLI